MDDNKKYKSRYASEDIRKYLEGGLSPEEMHKLEKAALEDPFLADAIEGMQHGINAEGKNFFAEDVADLRKKINEKTRNKNRIAGITWWKVAAVLIVLVTGIAVSYNLVNNKNSGAVIVSEVKTLPADTNKITQKETLMSQSAAPTEQPLLAPKREEKKAIRKQKAVDKKEELLQRPVPELQKSAAPELEKERNAVADPETYADNKQEREADTVARALQGRVAGVTTDNMNFDSNTMDEVVVSGYGTGQNKSRSSSAGDKRIVPKGGWDSFHEYIERNKLRNISDTSIHGTQEIGFRINDDGRPENFMIEESLSPEIDKAAIRLIMEGPSWEVIKGKKKKVRLKISY
jgi:hypothetical protein